ncbi:Hypothetical predicted protein [Lecanosticta acicola]|uniref:Calcium-dependent phosphotriesterase n=1 Tax=Lecanosticta acicola TaxID=111012 RepID=A0AAI8YRS7_9PEZI|nr:Hypothetical predicted protein [Lecanosticta acicola]
MGILRSTSAVLALLLSIFLYYRSSVLLTFYTNAPERLPRVNNLGQYDLRFQHLIRNCEDLALNEQEGWVLLSCDPGRDEWNTVMGTFLNPTKALGTGLFLYRYAENAPETNTPEMLRLLPFEDGHADFHPLGLDHHAASQTLFVANHAASGSKIEIYHFDPVQVSATLLTTLEGEDSQILTPNSIAAISGTEFLFTNDHYFRVRDHPLLAKVETYAGIPGGGVVHVRLSPDGDGREVTPLARIAFANGVVLLNESTVAVASSGSAAIFLYHMTTTTNETTAAPPKLTPTGRIALPFIPDNLSVDGKGKLLVAGHPHAPSLEAVAKKNRMCHDQDGDGCQLNRLSWIAEWSEADGLETLYVGDEFGTSSTAVRDVGRGIGIASGLYERGLLVWKS